MAECRHYLIQGRVQGVFYRSNTAKKAKSLHLAGWVRNCEDGSVECLACGLSDQLDEFEKWLWRGPIAAKVNHIQSKKVDFEDHENFKIKY